MRALVVADVHANLPALEAVLADAGPVDAVWCLGDVVGLGPWPQECADLLRERGALGVLGNHDAGALGRGGDEFARNALLAESSPWTRAMLAPDALSDRAPLRLVAGLTLVHDAAGGASPARLPRASDLDALETPSALVGHVHVPYALERGVLRVGDAIDLREGRAIVNPGPVGVPDWLPGHGSYGLVEDGVLSIRQVVVDPTRGLAECARRNAPPQVMAYWRRQAADAARAGGDLATARALYRAASEPFRSGGSPRQAALLLDGLARLALAEGEPERAARLLGAALGPPSGPLDTADAVAAMAASLEALHPVARLRFEAALDRLRALLGRSAAPLVLAARSVGLLDALAPSSC